MSRTWVNGGPPFLNAANLNALETDVTTALGVPDAALAARVVTGATATALNSTYAPASGSANYASFISVAKNLDAIVAGSVTVDSSNYVTSAAVVWPDGTPGTLTITSRDANGAVLAYNVTYGSPVTKTYTQPTITRNTAGAATNVPQIVVT